MAQGSRAAKNLIYKKMGKKMNDYSPKKAAMGMDIGKPGKMFHKIEEMGDKKYGKGKGAKIAGAVLKRLRRK